MSISKNIDKIKRELPPTTKLVAVSKYQPIEAILEAYNCGHIAFGENRPQELKEKVGQLPNDIEWHFIGHLQSNKIKMVVPYASLIHSVDSEKLLFEINKYCLRSNYQANVLLELHIAKEETKHGFSEEELFKLLDKVVELEKLEAVNICGLMSMATFTDDYDQIRAEFLFLRSVFDKIKKEYKSLKDFNQLSMGMSNDFPIAIECGSTMVRIGTTIFKTTEQ